MEEVIERLNERTSKQLVIARTRDTVYHRGKPVSVEGIQIDNKRLIVQGRFLTVARLRDEWYEEPGDPELIIKALKRCSPRPDIFTFWQRLPDTVPLYSYRHEPQFLSALPLKDFKYWWEKQIKSDIR